MDRLHHTIHHNLICLHTGQRTMQGKIILARSRDRKTDIRVVLGSAAPGMNINEGT